MFPDGVKYLVRVVPDLTCHEPYVDHTWSCFVFLGLRREVSRDFIATKKHEIYLNCPCNAWSNVSKLLYLGVKKEMF
jgi:hypothetical protein